MCLLILLIVVRILVCAKQFRTQSHVVSRSSRSLTQSHVVFHAFLHAVFHAVFHVVSRSYPRSSPSQLSTQFLAVATTHIHRRISTLVIRCPLKTTGPLNPLIHGCTAYRSL